MKKLVVLMLLASQAHSFTVLNERIWCSGVANCNGNIRIIERGSSKGLGSNGIETTRAGVILTDQKGIQGLEIGLGATHSFYLYNGGPSPSAHTLKAKLCDMKNKCFNYEKTIVVDWKESYSEVVYSRLLLFKDTIGAEPISAISHINGYPADYTKKEAMLLVEPFPYDQ